MRLFDRAFVTVPCPACTYAVEVQFRSIRLEDRVFCPCCKVAIRLVDAEASNYVASARIDGAVADLRQTIDSLNRTLSFEL